MLTYALLGEGQKPIGAPFLLMGPHAAKAMSVACEKYDNLPGFPVQTEQRVCT